MLWVWSIGLVVVQLVGWVLNFFTLPGNWLMVAAVAVVAWFGPDASRANLGWPTVAAAVTLACLGEAVEFLASAAWARKAGGSKRAALFAMVGSLIGSLVGVGVGLPIPIFGPVSPPSCLPDWVRWAVPYLANGTLAGPGTR